jgi:hypothetical protein
MPVSFLNSTVVKRQAPESARRELAKASAAYELSRHTKLFRAPRIVSVDADSGTLVFERLVGFCALRAALAAMSEDAQHETLTKVARILRVVHESLPLSPPWSHEVLDAASRPVLQGKLHGDFTLDNLLYETSTGELAVIDWSMPAWLDRHVCVGPVAIDLVGMAISLFNQRIVQRRQLRHPERLAAGFLAAYQRDLVSSAPLQLFSVFSANFARCLEAQRRTSGWQFPLYRWHNRRLVDFMTSLCTGPATSGSSLSLQANRP